MPDEPHGSNSRLRESLTSSRHNFYKANCAIRCRNVLQTKGMACAVNLYGQQEDKTRDSVLLLTWKGCVEETNDDLVMYRFSREHFGQYHLNSSRLFHDENFSLIECNCSDNSKERKDWEVRLKIQCLERNEQATHFLVYTTNGPKCLDLKLVYDEITRKHDVINDGHFDLKLSGAPIIDQNNFFVGVLRKDPDHANTFIPCFISKEVLDRLKEKRENDMAEAQERNREEPVADKPQFTEHPQSKTVVQGSSVTFSSDANGVPEPTFSWTKGGLALPDNDRISLSAGNKQLSITNVNRTDSGKYRCVAHNSVNSVHSSAATLIVQDAAGQHGWYQRVLMAIGGNRLIDGLPSVTTITEVVKNVLVCALVVDELKRRIWSVEPYNSILVELHCYTAQNFLSLMKDFKTGRVKRRLLKEFEKVGCEGELEVTLVNKAEVYEAQNQMRQWMAMSKREGEIPEAADADDEYIKLSYFIHGNSGSREDDIAASAVSSEEQEPDWDPRKPDVAFTTASFEGEQTMRKDVECEIPAAAVEDDSKEQDVAFSIVAQKREDTQTMGVVLKGKIPPYDSSEPLSVLLAGLSEEPETGSDYTSEQLNYLRLCYLAFVVVAQGLRMIFKRLWDNQYRKSRFGEWMDTPRNGKDFYNLESPRNHRKFPRQLATMINGNTEEWDCAMFFYAILYSDCLRHGVIEQVHSAVDDLRMLRNEIAHWPQAYVSYPDLSSICIRAEAAFESLNVPTIPLQIIRQKVHFSSESTKELAFLQFIEECTPEQVDYLRLCYLVFDVVPRGLRVIFKREWDIRFKERLGEWLDTPENGREFCKSARPDGQRRYLLATMVNGNREEWDSTMLFYAILQSKSIGSFLSLSVRLPVNDLREVRNETVKNVQGRLQAAEFERIVQKVQVAFETLDLSTSPIKDIMQQRMMRQQSGLPYVEGEVAKKQLQSVEYEHEKDVSSFCRLPFKPPIEIIGRDSEKEKILQELKTLKRNNGNSLSCLIISGRPGSGKSQLARQVAESFYDDATKVSDAPAFVMLLNAESSESLLESYTSFSQQIKCSEIEVSNILVSEEITSDEKIIRLKNLIQEKIHLYTTWLLVIDNVTGVRSILNSVPEVGNPQWKMGQMLIATRDAIGPELAVDSFTCHISISQGMEPGDAISLLAAVSGADDKEMLAKVAKELDYQPLALVTAATCVKHDCRSSKEPNLAWTEILNHLRADKEMESVSGDVSTPESSVLKSTDAVVCLAVESLIRTNEVIKYVLTCLSLFKPQEFDLDTLITYVQIVDLQHKKEITKTSESQIKECPLLLLGEEANNVRIGVHQVVLNGIKSALLEKRLPASSEVLAAVKLIHQMEIDPFEERRDELVFDDRIIPLLPS